MEKAREKAMNKLQEFLAHSSDTEYLNYVSEFLNFRLKTKYKDCQWLLVATNVNIRDENTCVMSSIQNDEFVIDILEATIDSVKRIMAEKSKSVTIN